MTIEEAEELMKQRNYHVTARSGDHTMVFMHHAIHPIAAEIRVDEYGTGFVKLITIIRMLQLTTGEFSVTHARFDDLFQGMILEVISNVTHLMG
jgi:hypothetical protein